jgi:hypothetical protein
LAQGHNRDGPRKHATPAAPGVILGRPLTADDWESLIAWLEMLEDAQIALQAFAELIAARGNRTRAGWLACDDVEGELR